MRVVRYAVWVNAHAMAHGCAASSMCRVFSRPIAPRATLTIRVVPQARCTHVSGGFHHVR